MFPRWMVVLLRKALAEQDLGALVELAAAFRKEGVTVLLAHDGLAGVLALEPVGDCPFVTLVVSPPESADDVPPLRVLAHRHDENGFVEEVTLAVGVDDVVVFLGGLKRS